jgi:predicted thioredoxin/glutaredoxin
VKGLGVEAEVVKVDSIDQIVERGVLSTPALFIDGRMRMAGRVPTVDELRRIIQE